MPKSISYTKGSIIYFSGDNEHKIYILQKGCVVVSSENLETGAPVAEQIKLGEFFGVKSALGNYPREETATALTDSVCIVLTVQEFEKIFASNRSVIIKMLRVFSKQLRTVHKQLQLILNPDTESNNQYGMYSVAKAFFEDQIWRSCADVCAKFLTISSNSVHKKNVEQMFKISKIRADAEKNSRQFDDAEIYENSNIAAIFSLPAFERFTKNYEQDEVIICEFEPGDKFYLIQKGQVRLVKCINGQNKNLDILKPGEFFGEMAILDNSPRSATCIANGPVQCLEFNKENFEIPIMSNPQIAMNILKLFSKRIHDQKKQLKLLSIKDLQARISYVFCLLDQMNPTQNQTTNKRNFNVTVQDIAHWAGLSIDVTKDELYRLVSNHKIELFESHITVNNILDLKRIVDTKAANRS